MRRRTSARIMMLGSLTNMSSVSATRPSVEFSSGTSPNSTWRRLTSSKTAAIEPTGTWIDGLTKLGHGGQVTVAVLGAKVSDMKRALQRTRAAHRARER